MAITTKSLKKAIESFDDKSKFADRGLFAGTRNLFTDNHAAIPETHHTMAYQTLARLSAITGNRSAASKHLSLSNLKSIDTGNKLGVLTETHRNTAITFDDAINHAASNKFFASYGAVSYLADQIFNVNSIATATDSADLQIEMKYLYLLSKAEKEDFVNYYNIVYPTAFCSTESTVVYPRMPEDISNDAFHALRSRISNVLDAYNKRFPTSCKAIEEAVDNHIGNDAWVDNLFTQQYGIQLQREVIQQIRNVNDSNEQYIKDAESFHNALASIAKNTATSGSLNDAGINNRLITDPGCETYNLAAIAEAACEQYYSLRAVGEEIAAKIRMEVLVTPTDGDAAITKQGLLKLLIALADKVDNSESYKHFYTVLNQVYPELNLPPMPANFLYCQTFVNKIKRACEANYDSYVNPVGIAVITTLDPSVITSKANELKTDLIATPYTNALITKINDLTDPTENDVKALEILASKASEATLKTLADVGITAPNSLITDIDQPISNFAALATAAATKFYTAPITGSMIGDRIRNTVPADDNVLAAKYLLLTNTDRTNFIAIFNDLGVYPKITTPTVTDDFYTTIVSAANDYVAHFNTTFAGREDEVERLSFKENARILGLNTVPPRPGDVNNVETHLKTSIDGIVSNRNLDKLALLIELTNTNASNFIAFIDRHRAEFGLPSTLTKQDIWQRFQTDTLISNYKKTLLDRLNKIPGQLLSAQIKDAADIHAAGILFSKVISNITQPAELMKIAVGNNDTRRFDSIVTSSLANRDQLKSDLVENYLNKLQTELASLYVSSFSTATDPATKDKQIALATFLNQIKDPANDFKAAFKALNLALNLVDATQVDAFLTKLTTAVNTVLFRGKLDRILLAPYEKNIIDQVKAYIADAKGARLANILGHYTTDAVGTETAYLDTPAKVIDLLSKAKLPIAANVNGDNAYLKHITDPVSLHENYYKPAVTGPTPAAAVKTPPRTIPKPTAADLKHEFKEYNATTEDDLIQADIDKLSEPEKTKLLINGLNRFNDLMFELDHLNAELDMALHLNHGEARYLAVRMKIRAIETQIKVVSEFLTTLPPAGSTSVTDDVVNVIKLTNCFFKYATDPATGNLNTGNITQVNKDNAKQAINMQVKITEMNQKIANCRNLYASAYVTSGTEKEFVGKTNRNFFVGSKLNHIITKDYPDTATQEAAIATFLKKQTVEGQPASSATSTGHLAFSGSTNAANKLDAGQIDKDTIVQFHPKIKSAFEYKRPSTTSDSPVTRMPETIIHAKNLGLLGKLRNKFSVPTLEVQKSATVLYSNMINDALREIHRVANLNGKELTHEEAMRELRRQTLELSGTFEPRIAIAIMHLAKLDGLNYTCTDSKLVASADKTFDAFNNSLNAPVNEKNKVITEFHQFFGKGLTADIMHHKSKVDAITHPEAITTTHRLR